VLAVARNRRLTKLGIGILGACTLFYAVVANIDMARSDTFIAYVMYGASAFFGLMTLTTIFFVYSWRRH
jgi:hypothetical protein